MLALLIGSWAFGWLLGGAGTEARKAMTLTTSLRNVGVGLVIASSAFAATPAVTAALAYGLFAVVGSLLLALAWTRRGAEISLNAEKKNPSSAEPVIK
jgi:BASS family bile acid:Na+ symporter